MNEMNELCVTRPANALRLMSNLHPSGCKEFGERKRQHGKLGINLFL